MAISRATAVGLRVVPSRLVSLPDAVTEAFGHLPLDSSSRVP